MAITTPTTRKRASIYSDFYKDFTQNVVNEDIARRTDEEAVKEAIRNLVLTDKFERPFQPDLGCNIRKMLFENIMPETLELTKQIIQDTLNAYEPRANILSVDATSAIDDNTINIRIVFNVINIIEPITLEFTLTKVR